ncbi:MAG: hypothetical protein ACP5RQ_02115, partial [Candidatus Micrarchaeia archaeon]
MNILKNNDFNFISKSRFFIFIMITLFLSTIISIHVASAQALTISPNSTYMIPGDLLNISINLNLLQQPNGAPANFILEYYPPYVTPPTTLNSGELPPFCPVGNIISSDFYSASVSYALSLYNVPSNPESGYNTTPCEILGGDFSDGQEVITMQKSPSSSIAIPLPLPILSTSFQGMWSIGNVLYISTRNVSAAPASYTIALYTQSSTNNNEYNLYQSESFNVNITNPAFTDINGTFAHAWPLTPINGQYSYSNTGGIAYVPIGFPFSFVDTGGFVSSSSKSGYNKGNLVFEFNSNTTMPPSTYFPLGPFGSGAITYSNEFNVGTDSYYFIFIPYLAPHAVLARPYINYSTAVYNQSYFSDVGAAAAVYTVNGLINCSDVYLSSSSGQTSLISAPGTNSLYCVYYE